jgi:hypothetical protein
VSKQKRTLALTSVLMALALPFILALFWGSGSVSLVRADPGVLYVDGATGSDDSDCNNPAAPCDTIGYALAQAGNGDEILVAAGTYTETLDVHGNPITLRGGYTVSGTVWLPRSGETIVDANGADRSVFSISPGNHVAIEGFTVQGAHNVSDYGGGFFINGATVVISDTVIRDNSTDGAGGGLYVEEVGGPAQISLIRSELWNNQAGDNGGGLAGSGLISLNSVDVLDNTAQGWGGGLKVDQVTITNCRIVSNTAVGRGGGVAAEAAYIYNSEISGNTLTGAGTIFGGGIDVGGSGAGRIVIADSIVSDNQALGDESIGGGIGAEFAKATIANTIVRNNFADIRGGVSVYQTVLTMTNSLLISNTSDGIGGAHVTGAIVNVTSANNADGGIVVGGAVSITNSIMWGNGGSDYACMGGCSLTYSDVEDEEITGTGNIYADPLFVDPASGDYHLLPGSPCIDAGTAAGAPLTDIEGTPRDAWPDMGTYEWTGFRFFLPLVVCNYPPVVYVLVPQAGQAEAMEDAPQAFQTDTGIDVVFEGAMWTEWTWIRF